MNQPKTRDTMTANLTPLHQRRDVALAVADAVEQLVKSRDRVKIYGEVFTPQRMVNQMLDLVRPELETGPRFVDKTFFEPAAGDGSFLIAILRRKLAAIERRYQPEFWPSESLFALASIYGVELLADNHEAARQGMLDEFVGFHQRHGTACSRRTNLWRAARFLVDSNIQRGNTLTGFDHDGREITFSWWNRVLSVPGMVQRDPFTFNSLHIADAGMFNFAVNESYSPCRIEHVHLEARADD